MFESLQLALEMLHQPSQALWQLKYEQKGRMSTAFLIMAVAILLRIAWVYGTGFVFRSPMYLQNEYIRGTDEIWTYLIVWMTWILANWGVSTLSDGEGTLRDVAIASAYTLMPVIALTLPQILLSNVLTKPEAGLYTLISQGSWLWTVYLAYIHVRTTHDYGTAKAIGILVLTVIGMLLLWALVTLLYLMAGQIGVFVQNIQQEINLRGGI